MCIRLRPTRPEDVEYVLGAERDPANRSFVAQWSEAQHRAALQDDDIRHLVVAAEDDDTPVGYVILAGVMSSDASVEFRRLVITRKGNGYGREAVRQVKRFAFEECGAHRLWLDVRDYNVRAQRLYASEGFVVEGTLRECVRTGESFDSLVVMSMLRQEYGRYGE